MDYTNEQIKAAAECCVKPFNCPMCPLKHTGCGAILATRLLALESENADLKKQLVESEKREKAMLAQLCTIKDCHTCVHYVRDCGLDIECKRPACNWWKLYYEYSGVSEKGE